MKPRNVMLIITALSIPIIIAGTYYVTRIRSRASSIVVISNAKAVRISNAAAEITFLTDIPATTTLQCSMTRGGVKFFAGQDSEASTQRLINTQQFNVTLNPNTSYYCYIYVGDQSPTEVYVAANPLSRTFGIDGSAYSNAVYGACTGDDNFNPALDINQDGCILLNDLNEFPEFP